MTGPTPRPEILTIDPYVAGESEIAGRQPDGEAVVQRGRVRRAAVGAGRDRRRPRRRSTAIPTAAPTGCARRSAGAGGWIPARIVCGAGSDDLLYQFCLSYGGPGRDIIMSAHGFCDLPDRRDLCRQPGDQGAGAQPDRRSGRDAGGGVAGDAAGVPGQPEQPDRVDGAGRGGRPVPRRAAAGGAAGAGRRLCRIRHPSGLRCRRQAGGRRPTTR